MGEIATVKTAHHTYHYRLTRKQIIKATDVTVIAPTQQSRLTLITCDSANPQTTNRLMLQGQQIKKP